MGVHLDGTKLTEMAAPVCLKIRDLIDCSGRGTSNVDYHDNGIYCEHWVDEAIIASWKLEYFPGNDRILVSTHAWVKQLYRRLGIGKLTHELRIAYAKAMGARMLLCTINGRNAAQWHILQTHNWTLHSSYFDAADSVYLFAKQL